MTVATAQPATDKQLVFARRLIEEKDWSHFGEDTLSDLLAVKSGESISKKYASGLIDALLAAPKKPVAVVANTGATVQLTEGIYEAPNGDIIKLQKSKSSGNLYAKVAVAITGERLTMTGDVVKFSYEYAPGLVKHITPAMRMNEAMAEAFAIRFGVCAWCGRGLKAAKSVKQGIGPVCIKRFA